MHVASLGLTPLKGTARNAPERGHVDAEGLRHDRVFCLVDPSRRRVLRTVEDPTTLRWRATFDGARLAVALPGGRTVTGEVVDGEPLDAGYWAQTLPLRAVEGPWSAALSEAVGRPVLLARSGRARGVVYDGAVTLVTTASVRALAEHLGRPDLDDAGLLEEAERWRANVLVDTGTAPPFAEDEWLGRDLGVGGAVLRVRHGVPRCAVTRFRPSDGEREAADPLRALADAGRVEEGALVFGVDAEVVRPGPVAVGDPVVVTGGTAG